MFWECILKTSTATLAVWTFSFLLRRQSAALRHSLWMCALAAFLVVPAVLPLAFRTPSVTVPMAVERTFSKALDSPLPHIILQPAQPMPPGAQKKRVPILLTLWLTGAFILCIRRTRAALRMKYIAARSRAALNQPGVRISAEIRAPLTWGLFQPLILLPSCAANWTPDSLRSILAHEREHIRRFDSLSHWLAELVCVAWWFHPCAWLARDRAAHERECACDDAVLRSGVRPSDYAVELLNLVSTLPTKGEPLMALSVLSNFEKRIKKILIAQINRRPAAPRAHAVVALTAFAVIIPLAILHAQSPAGLGDLSGTVSDVSGARVPNAMVTASGSGGNREVTRTDESGAWALSGIPSGTYSIEVAAPGFRLATQPITLAPDQRATMEQTLQLGRVQETITVVAPGQARHATSPAVSSAQRIRVGGNVQATKLLRQVKPAYPESAQSQGIEGTVLLNAVIGTDGNLLSLVVMNRLADPDLAAAALDAVKQWHYQPTLLNGAPVEVVTTITVNFKLQM